MSHGGICCPERDRPLWWRSAVIHQSYVRRVADGNGDGTGDIEGVRARLRYLRDLDVDVIRFTRGTDPRSLMAPTTWPTTVICIRIRRPERR